MTPGQRRRAMKASMVNALATTAYDLTAWETVWDAADQLGATERLVESLANEIGDELMRRAARLGYAYDPET